MFHRLTTLQNVALQTFFASVLMEKMNKTFNFYTGPCEINHNQSFLFVPPSIFRTLSAKLFFILFYFDIAENEENREDVREIANFERFCMMKLWPKLSADDEDQSQRLVFLSKLQPYFILEVFEGDLLERGAYERVGAL